METKQDRPLKWVTFFDEYAGDFHPSFKQKLAKELFGKGSIETGIRDFEKYDFQLLIGQQDLKIQQLQEYMFALADFITPPAFSQPVWICWKTNGLDVTTLHSKDVSDINIEFHWGGNFPKENVLPYLNPYKKETKNKTKLRFDTEYYHNAFPEISLELVFTTLPKQEQIEIINNTIADFINAWNFKNKDKIINYVSSLTKIGESEYVVVADMGVSNSIRTVTLLLKALSDQVQPDLISKIKLR